METLGSVVHVLGRAWMDSKGAVCFKDVSRARWALPGTTPQPWGQGEITGQAYPPLPLVLATVPGSPEL